MMGAQFTMVMARQPSSFPSSLSLWGNLGLFKKGAFLSTVFPTVLQIHCATHSLNSQRPVPSGIPTYQELWVPASPQGHDWGGWIPLIFTSCLWRLRVICLQLLLFLWENSPEQRSEDSWTRAMRCIFLQPITKPKQVKRPKLWLLAWILLVCSAAAADEDDGSKNTQWYHGHQV